MIDFKTDYVLENNSVRLEPLKISDFDRLVAFSIHEPELWKYSLLPANSPQLLKLYIEKAINDRSNYSAYPFIVFDKSKNQYAGSTRFYDIQLDQFTLQLGYTWYGKNFQGTGLNKNCKYLLLEFAFEVLKMERVEFRADNENSRSINAMKSIGCTFEGILRSNSMRTDGGRRDSIILSILKEEWKESVKNNLMTFINR